ncbi:MAG: ribonuclease HII [Acidobacteria bacterium]|nr:ribonuclease HII [Acidobacteriota bacterium]
MDKEIESFLSKTVHELKETLHARGPDVSGKLLEALAADPRKTARQLADGIQRRRLRDLREDERLHNLLHFEQELYQAGYRLIAGVDEAGVAPLAGPVVAAAVILPQNYKLIGLNDSKKIPNHRKREMLAQQIKQDAVCWATGAAEVEEIDRLNVYRSGLLAMKRAVESLVPKPEYVLVDARTIPHCPIPQKAIVHGDALCAAIAAASLIAKTTRDAHMAELDRIYSGYGFADHKGYPTPEHLKVLKQRGPLPVHRKSFAPVREALDMDPAQQDLFAANPSDG